MSNTNRIGPKAQRAAETRAALLGEARKLFAAQGFAATGTEAVLAHTTLTRGALYHHFADKQALFAAVCETLHAEGAQTIESAAAAAPNAYEAVIQGSLAFLDFMVRPDVRRILLIDAPSVLGWAQWNEMDRRHGYGLLIEGVEEAVAAGELRGEPDILAVMINGALNQAAVWVGQANEPRALARVKAGFIAWMAALRVRRS
ncbi:MAG: TetR/AcrR family transcriptional regulator [Phenylobacterium sp.]|jgi:AcrR family transcriptional regulator|uniref:TetR/AcrR family transcriptional regulator n=1 Tax=Phenylobacterium sp. TaxID=1871053 RepID=UPI00391BD750